MPSMSNDGVHQQAMNRGTWESLQDAGVVAGEPLTVDAYFFAPDESSSASLVAGLQADGWVAKG
jgi:hypothetical protein